MAVSFTKGKMLEFVANRTFSINFEDKTPSTKIHDGESLQYDGNTMVFSNKLGVEVRGNTPHLKSAVTYGWLEPTGESIDSDYDTPNLPAEATPKLENLPKDYEAKKGGSFETMIKKEQQEDIIERKHELITEDEQIVKTTKFDKKSSESKEKEGGKLEVAGDQVSVKDLSGSKGTIVGSTTAPASMRQKQASTVIQSEQYGADSSTPIVKKISDTPSSEKRRKTFTVDEHTPSIPEDVTMGEVRKAMGVINADESQDAKVVKKITQGSMEVQQIDGVTLKKTPEKKEMTIETKVGSGGDSVANLSGATSQADVDAMEAGETVVKEIRSTDELKETDLQEVKQESTEQEPEQTEKAPNAGNYLDQLPEDWAKEHWTRKEKFIKDLTDVNFVKFIQTVETVKAVQNACEKRLEELA